MKKTVKMCEKCKARRATQVHHIDGNHDNDDPKNLMDVCAFCHAIFEGRSPNLAIAKVEYENLKDLEKTRISIENRKRSFDAWEIDTSLLREQVKTIAGLERKAERRLIEAVKDKKIVGWLTGIKGVGDKTAAELIALIGDVGRFDTISSLWHYAGLHVDEGKAPKPRKGKKIDYYPKLKSLCLGIIGQNFIRLNSPYRHFYDEKKNFYEKNREWLKLHRHRAAMRYMVKMFLKNLWLEWRRLEDLPITEAHPQDQPKILMETKVEVRHPAGVGDNASWPDHETLETHGANVPPAGPTITEGAK